MKRGCSGPCNSFHCLGQFKNVYDDDDDDDDAGNAKRDDVRASHRPRVSANPPYRTLSFFSFRFHYMDFPDCLLLLLSIFVFLLFSFSVFTLFSCRFRAVD